MRTFIENYLHFMKNCIRPPYEKLKSLKSGFIENSNFENNRDPCLVTTWWPLDDHLVTTCWLLGDIPDICHFFYAHTFSGLKILHWFDPQITHNCDIYLTCDKSAYYHRSNVPPQTAVCVRSRLDAKNQNRRHLVHASVTGIALSPAMFSLRSG